MSLSSERKEHAQAHSLITSTCSPIATLKKNNYSSSANTVLLLLLRWRL